MPGRVAVLVHGLGGRATWQQLLQCTTSHQVRQAVRRGEILRAGAGIYTLPELSDERRAAAGARGALCLESAARAHGLPTLRPPEEVHVMVPHGRRPPVVPGVRYRFSELTPDELRDGRTSLLKTVLDCAAVLPLRDALAIADAALNSGRLGEAQLVGAAEQLRGPLRARRLRVARAADRKADSPLESALRAVLLDAGITGFTTQALVEVGFWGIHVDLGDPRRRIALEAEGFEFHAATRRDFDRDLRRYDEVTRLGWAVLRFNWEQVMLRPAWVLAVIQDVIADRAA